MYSHHSKNGGNTAVTPKYKLNTVLMEEDGWRLVRPLHPDLLSCDSYIVHIKCNGGSAERWSDGLSTVQGVSRRTPKQCAYCGGVPPASLLGLEILHNGKI